MEVCRSGLGRMLRNLVHPLHRDGQQVQHAEVDEVPAHGFIQAGGHQQEGEELHHVQPPLQKHGAAHHGDGADADLQYQLGRNDERSLTQLRADGFLLHIVDLLLQFRQIRSLRVAALQIAGYLDELLHGVVQPHLGSRLTANEMGLYFFRRRHDEDGDGDRPHRCQGHLPFVKEKPYCDQRRGDQAPVELRDLVGGGVLQGLGIRHDGIRQVRQILFPEERQGELSQFFRQGDAAFPGLNVGCKEGGVVLPVVRKIDQHQAKCRKKQIVNPSSGGCAGEIRPGECEQQPYGRHQGDIRDGHRRDRFEHIRRAFFRQREPLHQILLHTASPTFQLTAF